MGLKGVENVVGLRSILNVDYAINNADYDLDLNAGNVIDFKIS